MKKSFLVLLALLLTATVYLAACSNEPDDADQPAVSATNSQEAAGTSTEETAESSAANDYGDIGGLALPISQEKVTLKAITWTYPETPLPENFFTQQLEKRTNVKVEVERYLADDPTEKLGLLVASNDLPDMVGMMSASLAAKLGVENFIPINKYLDILPNFRKVLEENPQIMKSYTNADGNLYVFDYLAYKISPKVNYGMIYRKDVFDKLGIGAPSGPDEYYEAFKKLKAAYPDSYPLINYYGMDGLAMLSESWGTYWKMFLPDGGSQWKYGPVSDEYKDMLVYLNKLYKEGLMDPEFLTSTEDRFSSLILQPDKGFVFRGWFGRMDSLANTAKGTLPEFELAPANFIGPYGKVMHEAKLFDWGMSISAKSKNIKEALKVVDYLYSPSGSTLVSMGVEGETFKVEADGSISYPGFEGQTVTSAELMKKYGLTMNNFMFAADPRSSNSAVSPKFQEALDLLQDPFWAEEQPIMTFTEEEQTRKIALEDALMKAVQEYSARVIMGSESIDKWDGWVQKNVSLGYQELENLYDTAYSRYLSQ